MLIKENGVASDVCDQPRINKAPETSRRDLIRVLDRLSEVLKACPSTEGTFDLQTRTILSNWGDESHCYFEFEQPEGSFPVTFDLNVTQGIALIRLER